MTNNNDNGKKLNAGCIKIFQFLRLLYDDEAYYSRVVEIFKDEVSSKNEPNSNNIQVVINKYVNALKIFGIKIVKEKNKYKLLSSLYSMELTSDDIKSISILLSSTENFPDKKLGGNVKDFINKIELRMNNEDKNTLNSLVKNSNYDFSFYYTDLREQINQCIDLAEHNRIVNLVYINKKKEKQIKCRVKEVIFESKTVYLLVHDTLARENIQIALPNILSIDDTLANTMDTKEYNTTVVFNLKGRLAKTYQLKPGEDSEPLANGDLKVTTHEGEPLEMLLSRLMRYSTSCEVTYPKFIKDKMIALINDTLSNYEEDLEEKLVEEKKVKKTKSILKDSRAKNGRKSRNYTISNTGNLLSDDAGSNTRRKNS